MTFRTPQAFVAGLVLSGAIVVSGCKEKKEDAPSPSAASSAAAEKQPANAPAANTAAAGTVEVAADGTRFDPSVASSRIPDDTWMCDMNGQVHYASLEAGDGKCPVCSMRLVKKGAPGAGSDDHDDGHEDHRDDGHKGHDHHEGH